MGGLCSIAHNHAVRESWSTRRLGVELQEDGVKDVVAVGLGHAGAHQIAVDGPLDKGPLMEPMQTKSAELATLRSGLSSRAGQQACETEWDSK